MMMEPEDLQLKYKPMKVCGICGDKALGYNFNAVTCEACKAFFRRNALRTKDFKCPFDGNCKIDLVTRRFCQKCRLKKCFDIGMKKEWILSDDEKKTKRDKIVENRRKKDVHGHPYNLDAYSSSSMDETSYSPEMNPSMKGLNNEILNSNYSLSVSEGKGFFNSLYLLEQYQNQYQNFMSGKTPKEPPIVPYSTPIAKVPSHSGEHPHGGAKCDSTFIQSSASVASTSNGTSMMDGYLQGMYPKGLEPTQPTKPFDYGYGPYAANHNRASLNPHLNRHTVNNGHLNGHLPMQPDKAGPVPHHPAPSSSSSSSTQYYPKGTFDGRPVPNGGVGDVNSRRTLDQMLSTNSLYNCNSFYQEKINSGRSRSESQITSPSPVLNNKSPQLRQNGSTDNGFVKESGKFLPTARVGPPQTSSGARSSTESIEYLSSDDDNMSSRVPPYATAVEYLKSDLNEDSNSVLSNCDARSKQGDAEMSANISSSRNSPSVKASHSVYNFIEELRMQELTMACDTLRPWGQYQKVVGEMAQLTEMYEAAEQVIPKVIEMAQMVTTFQDLCKNEQQTLLKGAVTEMLILRAVLNYIPEENTWVFNLRNTPEEGQFLKYSTYEKLICKSYVEVKQFMHSFSQDWKSDRTLFDLLTVIVLFSPNRPDLKHKEIIKLEYLTWRHLLQKHLDSKMTSKDLSRNYFTSLMDLLERLHTINEKVNKQYTFNIIESCVKL